MGNTLKDGCNNKLKTDLEIVSQTISIYKKYLILHLILDKIMDSTSL